MPDLLTELQSALSAGMPINGITDNDIGRWKTGIVPQAMWEDNVVGALMRFCWEQEWSVCIYALWSSTWVSRRNGSAAESGTGPLPLLRAVRKAWEAAGRTR